MGSFLDKPIVDKETHNGEGNKLRWGLSSMQGWRVEMEDAHIAQTELEGLPGCSFFAVFDGHGGSTVSKICGTDVVDSILATDALKSAADKMDLDVLKQALQKGLLELDDKMRAENSDLDSADDRSGSTAICVLVTPSSLIFANCGDSRAVFCSDGAVKFATSDHKPTDAGETARIKKAGGTVEMGRVCGNLAVSRALGDYVYKDRPDLPAGEQKISAEADITVIPRDDKDQFLLVACDGIYDVMTNEAAVEFITNQIKAGYKPHEISERLLDYCLHLDSKDNMSAIVVLFEGAPAPEDGFKAPEEIPDVHSLYPKEDGDNNQQAQPAPQDLLSSLQALLGGNLRGVVQQGDGSDGNSS